MAGGGGALRWDRRAEGILVWPLSKDIDDLNLMGSRLGKATNPHHFKMLTQLQQRPCGRRRMDLFNVEEHKAYVAVKGGEAPDGWKKMKLTASLKPPWGSRCQQTAAGRAPRPAGAQAPRPAGAPAYGGDPPGSQLFQHTTDVFGRRFRACPCAVGEVLNQHKEEKSLDPHPTGCSLTSAGVAGGNPHGQSAGG